VTTLSKEVVASKAKNSTLLLKSAFDWVTKSEDVEISGNQRLLKDLKTSIYQSQNLQFAAAAKMCVGVYGPSQAGKSYLVSALARRPGTKMLALMSGVEVDFIEAINPEGGKESTGLVTRFTIDRIEPPAGFPLQLKLLSEIDLVKLFVNSYANDILKDEDEDLQLHQEQAQLVLAELENLPRGISPYTAEDVYDLEDYCNKRFSDNFRIQALKKMDFWPRAADLLPVLGMSGRLRLVQVLWEELPSFSGLFSNLASELSRLNHAPQLFASASALFRTDGNAWSRSESSIINVATLDQLGDPNSPNVDVLIPGSPPLRIALPNLCALTSELVITLKDKPHEIFERADLLDFPGARSRKGQPKGDKTLSQPSVQIGNFLRGKVAYLFDKYSAQLELTSMVLCIGPLNQEVVGLDAMVEDWIIKTHGDKPESREKLKTALFLVLTKFDQEFAEGAGKTLDGTRWSTRLHASLLNSFGAHAHKTNWVNKWSTQSAFNNIFWLRNPNADQSGLIEYQGAPGESKEIAFAQKKVAVIGALRAAFLTHPLVRLHFADPAAAWDSGMALNDGGSTYLMARLDEACTDDLKLKQIDERLQKLVSDRYADLKKFYLHSDLVGLERDKFELAQEVVTSLLNNFKHDRLGEFIDALLQSDIDTLDTFNRTLLEFERQKYATASSIGSAVGRSVDTQMATELGLDLPISTPGSDDSSNKNQRSFPVIFLQRFMDDWRVRCADKFSSSNLSNYIHAEREMVLRLLVELEIALKRVGLHDSLTEYVERNHHYLSDDRRNWVWRQTAVVTARFNAFLARGGILPGDSAISVKNLSGKSTVVFEPHAEATTEIDVNEFQSDYSKRYFTDWIQSVQHSIRANAAFQAGFNSDAASNQLLGGVLSGMENLLRMESNKNAASANHT
jgi:hypothetical protein